MKFKIAIEGTHTQVADDGEAVVIVGLHSLVMDVPTYKEFLAFMDNNLEKEVNLTTKQ